MRKLSATTGKARLEAITAPSASDTEAEQDDSQPATILPGYVESEDLFGGAVAPPEEESLGIHEAQESSDEEEDGEEESSEEPEVIGSATVEEEEQVSQ